jgi:serine/threonine protein kinase
MTIDREFVQYILQGILEALVQVHHAGIVHGDLKPSNILLSSVGTVKLTGFGRGYRSRSSEPYLAPEQIQTGGELTPAVDIYQVGIILHELLGVIDDPQLIALQKTLIKKEPTERPSAADVLRELRALGPKSTFTWDPVMNESNVDICQEWPESASLIMSDMPNACFRRIGDIGPGVRPRMAHEAQDDRTGPPTEEEAIPGINRPDPDLGDPQ